MAENERKTWIMYKKGIQTIPCEKPMNIYHGGVLAAYDAKYNVKGGHLKNTASWINYVDEDPTKTLTVDPTYWRDNGYFLNGDTYFDFSEYVKNKWAVTIELGLITDPNSSGTLLEIKNTAGDIVGMNIVGNKVYTYRNDKIYRADYADNPRYLRQGYASYKNVSNRHMRCSRQWSDANRTIGDWSLFDHYGISQPVAAFVGCNTQGTNKTTNVILQYMKISCNNWVLWNGEEEVSKKTYNILVNRYI